MTIKSASIAALILLFSANLFAASPDEKQLKNQLDQFLYGASINDHDVHDQFWSDELIYTSSSGNRFGKQALMESVRSQPSIDEDQVDAWYSARDVEITLYGNLATLAFTLVAEDENPNVEQKHYLNSGTFIWRNDRWQALIWHATIKKVD